MTKISVKERYFRVFRQECNRLIVKLGVSLNELCENPKNINEIWNVVQIADVLLGNSLFLENKELETLTRKIVKNLTGLEDVSDIIFNIIDDYAEIVKTVISLNVIKIKV